MGKRSVSTVSVKDSQILRECPFCGGEASTYSMETWWVSHACDCLGKYVGTKEYATEAEAIAAWNSRAERTCFADEVTHRDCKYSVNRGWRERTCKCVAEYASSPIDGKTIVLHRCSACHNLMRPTMLYCPTCGARVVE